MNQTLQETVQLTEAMIFITNKLKNAEAVLLSFESARRPVTPVTLKVYHQLVADACTKALCSCAIIPVETYENLRTIINSFASRVEIVTPPRTPVFTK